MTAEVVPLPTPADSAPAELTTPQLAVRFLQLLAFEGLVKDYVTRERGILRDRLLDLNETAGAKSVAARDDNGTALGTFTLKETKESVKVSDSEAFLDWVIENYPTEVETITQVRPAWTKTFTEKVVDASEDGVVDPKTGELVPGLSYVPAPAMSSFGTSWATGGKETVVGAVIGTSLSELGLVTEED